MPECRECKDEVDKLVSVKVAGKARKVCEDCADRLREEGEVAEAKSIRLKDKLARLKQQMQHLREMEIAVQAAPDHQLASVQ